MQEYYTADQQIHWLTQLLAKINRTFIEKRSDDSHTNLFFDSINQRMLGRWIESDEGKFILSLNLKDLSFELYDQYFNSIWLINSQGKSILEVEGQLDSGLDAVGLSDSSWKDQMHYEIPDYGFNKSPIERLSDSQINLWSDFRALANYACLDLLGSLQADSEMRIWPHHFDTGIYFKLSDQLGIGFGLAMKDEMAADAYFYLTAHSDTIHFDYSKFSSDGDWEWKSGEWKGALLRLNALSALDTNASLKMVKSFSSSALEQYCMQLA